MEAQAVFALPELPDPCYVVGGWVRDRLLGRVGGRLDLDLVLPARAVEVARQIANKLSGGFVVMDQERQIARVVLRDLTIDFAQQMGNSLTADLALRDFTLNAIALEVHRLTKNTEDTEYIDPHGGRADIQQKQIRMIAPDNLQADYLRVLRAYRLAAQLDFEIETATHHTLQAYAPGLATIATERVQMELCHLLMAGALGSHWLAQALQENILNPWIPASAIELERFQRIDSTIAHLTDRYPSLSDFFRQRLTRERSAIIVIKLAALLNSAHAIDTLGFSRQEQKWLIGILRHLPQLKTLIPATDPLMHYQFFQRVRDFFPALVAIALADGTEIKNLEPLLHRWLDPSDPLVYPINLVTGDELRGIFYLKPSPKIGELLEAVREAQIKGLVRDRESALELVKNILSLPQ